MKCVYSCARIRLIHKLFLPVTINDSNFSAFMYDCNFSQKWMRLQQLCNNIPLKIWIKLERRFYFVYRQQHKPSETTWTLQKGRNWRVWWLPPWNCHQFSQCGCLDIWQLVKNLVHRKGHRSFKLPRIWSIWDVNCRLWENVSRAPIRCDQITN